MSPNVSKRVWMLSAALSVPPTTAWAQTSTGVATVAQVAEGRALFQEGMRLVGQESWGEALEFFRRSRALISRPSTLFNIGSVLTRLGRMNEAITTLDEFLRVSDPAQNAAERAEAERLLADARRALVRLTLTLNVAEARVHIDGAPVDGSGAARALVLDPGERRVRVTAPGFEEQQFSLSLLPAIARSHRVDLREVPTRIVLAITPERSVVRVDGRDVGTAREVPVGPGEHVILVTAEGYLPLQRTARVDRGESVNLGLSLSRRARSNLTSSPWFWTVVGVVVVGTVAGIAVATVTLREDPYGGSTGTVLSGITF